MTDTEFLAKFGQTIRKIREKKGLSQEDFADRCELHRTYIGGIERGERNISVSNLNQIINCLGLSWYEFSALLFEDNYSEVREAHVIQTACDHIRFFDNVTETDFKLIEAYIIANINNPNYKSRDLIAEAFSLAVSKWPLENISDIWHHCIYRIYKEKKTGTDAEQSWVRTSGEGFELFIEKQYNPLINRHNLRIRNLISRDDKRSAITRLGLGDSIGSSKIDLIVEQKGKGKGIDSSGYGIVGAIHAKVSLAERVSDDIPASRILMRDGIESILVTLDVKSFPPPYGDLINRGELGTNEKPSDKRKYIEEHGDFSICVSFNKRTIPSGAKTSSGKKIETIQTIGPDDAFSRYLVERFSDR